MTASCWDVDTATAACHRCLGDLCLRLKTTVEGDPPTVRIVPLCPRCDVNAPEAQGLLAFFALHPAVEGGTVDEFAALVAEWVAVLPPPRVVDPAAFEEDVAAFLSGYFDDDQDMPTDDE